MKHQKLMKYPKRFCTSCNGDRYVYMVQHKAFSMYHCQHCREEISRVGDGQQGGATRKVRGGIDGKGLADILERKSVEALSSENPDVLSDEHSLWPVRDFDLEVQREDMLRAFKVALSGLTARQKQVLDAVDTYGSQEKAAISLGMTQQGIAATIKKIEKKLSQLGCFPGGEGLTSEDIIQ